MGGSCMLPQGPAWAEAAWPEPSSERRGDAVTLQSAPARAAVSQPALRGGIFLAAGALRTQGWCKWSRGRPLLPPTRSAPQTCPFPSQQQRGWLRTRWASALRSGAGCPFPTLSLLLLLILSRAQVPVTKGTSQSWLASGQRVKVRELSGWLTGQRTPWMEAGEERMAPPGGCDDGEQLRSPELSSLVPSPDYHGH